MSWSFLLCPQIDCKKLLMWHHQQRVRAQDAVIMMIEHVTGANPITATLVRNSAMDDGEENLVYNIQIDGRQFVSFRCQSAIFDA